MSIVQALLNHVLPRETGTLARDRSGPPVSWLAMTAMTVVTKATLQEKVILL